MSILSTASNQTLLTTSIPNFPNVNLGLSSQATTGGTTTLTASSNQQQHFTGSLSQTIIMPVASTLMEGQGYLIRNTSTQAITVESSGANLIQSMASDSLLIITCILNSGTSAASWDITYLVAPFVWSAISGTSQNANINNGYIVANAAQTTITLPATAAIGDTIKVRGLGAAGWILSANTGQTIKYITATTSSGGSLTSAEQYDNIEVTCIVANTTWSVAYAATTGLTIA